MRTAAIFGALFLLGLLTIQKGIVPSFQKVPSDFSNYYVSARLVLERAPIDSLYHKEWFRKQAEGHGGDAMGKFSPFPPVTAFVMVPLAWLPPLAAQQVFACINVLMLAGCIWLIFRITGWTWYESALLVMLSGWGLVNNFLFGQLYVGILLLTLLSYGWVNKNPIVGGAVLASISLLKYFPVAYLPAFWMDGRKKF